MNAADFDGWLDKRRAMNLVSELGLRSPTKAGVPERPAAVIDQSRSASAPHDGCAQGPRHSLVIKALERILNQWRLSSIRDVMGQIKAVTARFAQRHPSAVAWLSQVLSTNSLKAIVVQESAQRLHDHFRLDDPGIVPRVARTGVPYATGDVRHDPYYTEVFRGIASEQAVSIVVQGAKSQELSRYVVNQESKRSAQYHPASAELLRQDAEVELTPLLRELEALEASDAVACCWNPRRHGWGLREFLAGLLQQVKEEIAEDGVNNLHLAVWYVDQEDCVLSPIANTGFTHGVQFRESLPFSDAGLLGQLAISKDWDTGTWQQSLETTSPIYDTVGDDMGARGSRIIVTPELSVLKEVARFRIVVQFIALAPESEALLPNDDELRRFAGHIFDQVRSCVSLYPQLAADEVRRCIHECGSFPEQWQAVAKTIEKVLRAGAVTLYARPWRDEGNLHVIAATSPLKRTDGTTFAPDPDTRPFLSLLPSVHTAWDHESYAGTLAARPDALLCRNSFRHSGERLLRESFPLRPSSDYSESLARTESADPRFLGYSLPNLKDGSKSTAVALAVRPVDRAPFKAWDAAALVAMLKAATPMVQSWRDWAAVRLDEAHQVIEQTREEVRIILGTYALAIDHGQLARRKGSGHRYDTIQSVEPGIFQAMLTDRLARVETAPDRRQDPIPRIGSLSAFSREIAAHAYERAWRALIGERTRSEFGDAWSTRAQAAVLMESRGGEQRTVMHPLAFFHERLNVVPKIGANDDPRRLRVPDLGDDWRRFLDIGQPREFRTAFATILRIPFLAWIGQHAARGALTLDLPAKEIPSGANDFRMDLMLLARRLAAAWTASGSSLPRGRFVSKTPREEFRENLCCHLHAQSVQIHLPDPEGGLVTSEDVWVEPVLKFEREDCYERTMPDPDAKLFGIQEAINKNSIALRVPLVFGTTRVGHIVARWCGPELASYVSDPQMTRAIWVRDILAAWYLWSWSWTTKGHGNHDDALVFVDIHEEDGTWVTTHRFREGDFPPREPDFSHDRARRAFELVHPKLSP